MTNQWMNELQTRKKKIDVFLKEQGWNVDDRGSVITEVDTKQSKFKIQDYKRVDETLLNDEESKYADYLLLDSKGDPLAVIEAKRASKDPVVGLQQAEEYADDIKKQTGKDVFIFITNGYEIRYWNREAEASRLVKGFFSQDSLERIRFQNSVRKPLKGARIREDIVNRDYQIEAVKRVTEGIEKGRRKFLLVQATGTGKTRVSMALVDVLMQANRAQKVLFLADRKALRDQAYDDGFKRFFPNEAKSKIYSGDLDKNVRLYASTIQTFMECYQEFSPGDFDVIVSDEAHRSIYNKWKDVFTYFDAIQIGLTATPADLIERDTFRFFECEGKKPTYLYTYDQAVKDGWLADFRILAASTHHQIEGVRPEDVPAAIQDELANQGIDVEEINFEGTDIEKKVIVTGTNEADVKEFMEKCLKDQTGTIPAKSIIFAMSKKHAKRIYEAFEKLYPEYKGKLARMIISEDSRAQELLKRFKKESWPRVAISVDMLDTGVDVPEVCNLVFAKPVFSQIKFWQMIGRGTRHNKICEHPEWLPDGKKEYFLIFDFWKVFDYFQMHPEGKEISQSEAITARIFKTRLDKLQFFMDTKDYTNAAKAKLSVLNDVRRLPMESVSVREYQYDVEKALSPQLWDSIAAKPFEHLKTKITPLMRYQKDVNLSIATFTLKVEQLGLAILQNDRDQINRIKKMIGEYLDCLPVNSNIHEIKDKKDLIEKYLRPDFWETITYKDTEEMLKEIAPLMRYKRSEPVPVIKLDIDDVVKQRKIIEYGPDAEQEHVEVYREKVEKKIKEMIRSNKAIQKIKNDELLTEEDIQKLAETLYQPDLYITEEALQKAYEQHKGTLVQFIKKIMGKYHFPKPEETIEEEFKTFLIENGQNFNADQINFIRTVKEVFKVKKRINYTDFFDPPFTNISKAPLPLFQEDFLKEVVAFCEKVEAEIN